MGRKQSAMGRVVALVAVTQLGVVLAGEPPRVVQVVPDHGDVGVDPGLAEIRIEFDQAMHAGGWSLCGGGPAYPAASARPRWESDRVLVVPVKLEPGHTYQFSINCPAATNFRSAAGEAAEITPIMFTTAAAGEPAGAFAVLTAEQNREAIAALRKAIDERYSYRDLRVEDWDRLFAAAEQELAAAPTRAAFARAAARLLASAGDIHVTLGVGSARFATFRAAAPPNASIAAIEKSVTDLKKHNQTVMTGRVAEFGYILIAGWPGDDAALAPAHEALTQFVDAPGVIVDVRFNSGGDELQARKFASRFVEKQAVYSRNRTRDPRRPGGWTETYDRVIDAAPEGDRYKGKVVVLMGPACMSSNESFLLMMKHGAGAKLIGATSYGSSGNPRPVELGNGVTVILPSWEDQLPDGTPLEGRGVAPDIEVRFDSGAGVDAVLEAAESELKRE